MKASFATYHPAINFMFFVVTIGLGMFISHPVFIAVSCITAISYYFILVKGKGKRTLLFLIILFILVTVFNGVMNPAGDTVLFVWMNGRNFTLEALCYGALNGGMFVSSMMWFFCYNIVMTNDKFLYLFSRFAPSITCLLSMTLRLVPALQKQVNIIQGARNGIGKGVKGRNYVEKVQSGMEILSILTSRALEGAVMTSDSMQSRGYVDKRHTSYFSCKRTVRDYVIFIYMIITFSMVIFSVLRGCTFVEILPRIIFPKMTVVTVLGLVSYAILLLIPIFIECYEEILWHILKLKI